MPKCITALDRVYFSLCFQQKKTLLGQHCKRQITLVDPLFF